MLSAYRPPIQAIIEGFFDDIIAQKSPETLLSYFSTTHEIFVQHDHVDNPNPYPIVGRHAVRSYFDLLAVHWIRSELCIYKCSIEEQESRAEIKASVRWTWRASNKSWRELFSCTLLFDDTKKIKAFVLQTDSPKSTCVMHAVDQDNTNTKP